MRVYVVCMLICGQQFNEATIGRIITTVESNLTISRRELSRQVCSWLDWRNDNGGLKDMSCRKALLELDRRGKIILPSSPKHWTFSGRKALESDELLGDLEPMFCSLKELGAIEIAVVGDRRSRNARIWNVLMGRYHYLGNGPLCGGQIRYLIKSIGGKILGGLSFSSAAWRVSSRDRFIGWSDAARAENLKYVIGNSRFLIAPWVRVPNLASHVLSRCMRHLPEDWEERYGYSPKLVETFVHADRFSGTSYRAANWHEVGMTEGRGRQDREKKASVGRKRVFVYPVAGNWREILCNEPEPTGLVQVDTPERMHECGDWAENEFGRSQLSDERLTKRLLNVSRDFFARPGANIPQACGSRSKTKAAYRFFDNEQVTMEKLLQSHYEATRRRLKEHPVVLAAQDTTSLNYTAHPMTGGLGPINTKADGAIGLELHDTMAFTPEGTPLGLLDIQCWARDKEDREKSKKRNVLPIEEKESFKWLKSYRAVAEVQKKCPTTRLVSVGDRESDIYELISEALSNAKGPQLLVRSERSRRRNTEEGRLWEVMPKEPVAGSQHLYIPRKGGRKARTAKMEVRFKSIVLRPPKTKAHLPPLSVWAVYTREINAPGDVKEPVEWMLVTTVKTTTFEEACERISWYACRWGIEVYHRTLKSGCKIEDRQLGNTDRIEACLGIDLVVAWRIYFLTKQGRQTPDLPCDAFFEDGEWKALTCFVNKQPEPPQIPPTLRQAIRMVAALGGFLGRKSDGEPGTQTMWRGLQRLDDITATYRIFTANSCTVYSKTDYG